jgi:hypothetical protein
VTLHTGSLFASLTGITPISIIIIKAGYNLYPETEMAIIFAAIIGQWRFPSHLYRHEKTWILFVFSFTETANGMGDGYSFFVFFPLAMIILANPSRSVITSRIFYQSAQVTICVNGFVEDGTMILCHFTNDGGAPLHVNHPHDPNDHVGHGHGTTKVASSSSSFRSVCLAQCRRFDQFQLENSPNSKSQY